MLKVNQFHAFFRVGSSEATYLSYCKRYLLRKLIRYILMYYEYIFRDYMTLDRYTKERGIDFVPSLDVDSSIKSLADLAEIRWKIRDIIRCFDHPKFVHLGPKITAILLAEESCDEKISIYDYIPAPMEETTFLLCANSFPTGKASAKRLESLCKLPENSILLQYGFQVFSNFTKIIKTLLLYFLFIIKFANTGLLGPWIFCF